MNPKHYARLCLQRSQPKHYAVACTAAVHACSSSSHRRHGPQRHILACAAASTDAQTKAAINGSSSLPHPASSSEASQSIATGSDAGQSPKLSPGVSLDAQVAELRVLLEKQSAVIQQQQKLLEKLSAPQVAGGPLLGANGANNTPTIALPPPPVAGPPKRLSPFDAQAVAYVDRRLLGQYDARFHSTSA